MEYVKDAIEKARREREAKQPAEAAEVLPRRQELTDSDAIRVDYSQTRIEPLNKRVLLENRVVAAFEDDRRAEPYRQLRTQVLRKFRENSWRTLAITSAHEQAGKSLTAVNMAVALAKNVNQTVLLVDLDFKDPDVVDILGLNAQAGLLDYLQGDIGLESILINPGIERLTVLPSLPVSGVTSEILSSPRMKAVLEEIVSRYPDRIIVFDLPPLLTDDDALVFTPYVDTTLIVVENGVSTPDDLERCVQLLDGRSILGTILNKSD